MINIKVYKNNAFHDTEMTFADFYKLKVCDIWFSTRAGRCLENLGILYLHQLVRKTKGELLAQNNFGKKSLREIEEVLFDMGLQLGEALAPPKINMISGETIMFGEVVTVGGAEPHCRFRIADGTLVTIDLTKDLAKELGNKLYEIVSLRGVATWSSVTLEIKKFRVQEILPYKEIAPKDALKAIHDADPNAWKKVDDISLTIKEMRTKQKNIK